jgi:hypothetical protein
MQPRHSLLHTSWQGMRAGQAQRTRTHAPHTRPADHSREQSVLGRWGRYTCAGRGRPLPASTSLRPASGSSRRCRSARFSARLRQRPPAFGSRHSRLDLRACCYAAARVRLCTSLAGLPLAEPWQNPGRAARLIRTVAQVVVASSMATVTPAIT